MAKPKPVPWSAIQKSTVQDPEHQRKAITEYVESQTNKGAGTHHKVVHLEKLRTETVFGTEYVVWDVHTDEPGRWWVITEPTNLYSQEEFPSLDYTLSFHIGVTARVAARDAKAAPDTRKDRLRSTWRRWENAAEAIDTARESEDFQAIGMMCREVLVELAKVLQADVEVPEGQERPKASDFVGWFALIVSRYARGRRSEHIRSYLKANSKETWQLVNWLTHTSKASLYEAHLALDATSSLLAAMSLVVMQGEASPPTACPRCKSYRVVAVYEPGLEVDPPYVSLCEACGWNSYDEMTPNPSIERTA
jgi:hypothetical protein